LCRQDRLYPRCAVKIVCIRTELPGSFADGKRRLSEIY